MSYRKRHVKSKIHRIRPRKSIFGKLWFWLTVLILAIVSGSFYVSFFYPGLQIKNIIISGTENVKSQDLQELVSNDANIELLSFWKVKIISRSILFINNSKISSDILEKYPAIETAVVSKKLPETLMLNITERKPIGVFCDNNNQCFSIDSSGIIFDSTGSTQQGMTVIRQPFDDSQIFTGEEVVSKDIIGAIYKIQKNLKDNFQINLEEAFITSPVRLNAKTNENWQIYFDLSPNFDIDSQITKLNLLLTSEVSTAGRKSLRYIDLRPKDKAIVCDNSVCGG